MASVTPVIAPIIAVIPISLVRLPVVLSLIPAVLFNSVISFIPVPFLQFWSSVEALVRMMVAIVVPVITPRIVILVGAPQASLPPVVKDFVLSVVG